MKRQDLEIRREVERVYEQFRAEFRGYAVRHLFGNEDAADDALQETLVRAWGKQGAFSFDYGTSGLYAWLLAILKKVCAEKRRPHNNEQTGYSDIESLEDAYDLSDKRDDYEAILTAMESDEMRDTMAEIIAETSLTNYEWAVLTATRLGFSNAQIAREMSMSTNTVRAHVANSLPKLRHTMLSRSQN